jgi:hypothetical protein
LRGAVPLDGVLDPVGEQFVPFGTALPQVVGRPSPQGLAGDFLAALAGKEDEREVGTLLADGGEESDAVGAGHVVVADDAVDAVESVQRLPGIGRRLDLDVVALALEVGRGQLHELRLVVDVEHPDRPVHITAFNPPPENVWVRQTPVAAGQHDARNPVRGGEPTTPPKPKIAGHSRCTRRKPYIL